MLGLGLMMGWETRMMPDQKMKKMLEELISIYSVGEDGTHFPLYLLQTTAALLANAIQLHKFPHRESTYAQDPV